MDDYTVSPETFRSQMNWISQHGWKPTVLEDILGEKIESVPEHALVITFDDGFASNRSDAWPILQEYGFPSATFLVAARLGSRNTWDGPGRDDYELLSCNDLAGANAQLMRFHSHSLTHPVLPPLKPDALRKELEESKKAIALLNGSGSFFAYPFGAWSRQVVEHVGEAGYTGACTCIEGLNSKHTNPFLLRRVEIRECDTGWRLWLKLTTGRDLLAIREWIVRSRDWVKRGTRAIFGRAPH